MASAEACVNAKDHIVKLSYNRSCGKMRCDPVATVRIRLCRKGRTMNPFVYYNPVRLVFGKGSLGKLGGLAQAIGSKVRLVYGGGSIKRNGVYDGVLAQLNGVGATVHELGGVEPNPRLST